MSRAASSHRPSWPSYIALSLFIVMLTLSTTLQRVGASPLPDFMNIFGNPMPDNSAENSTTNSIENSTENLTASSTENSIENSTENLTASSTENSTTSSTENSTENFTASSTENSMTSSTENSMENLTASSTENSTDNSTEIAPNTDVYVIKAVVYEIGILTDTDNTTSSESTERQESVDISLYNVPQEDEFS